MSTQNGSTERPALDVRAHLQTLLSAQASQTVKMMARVSEDITERLDQRDPLASEVAVTDLLSAISMLREDLDALEALLGGAADPVDAGLVA